MVVISKMAYALDFAMIYRDDTELRGMLAYRDGLGLEAWIKDNISYAYDTGVLKSREELSRSVIAILLMVIADQDGESAIDAFGILDFILSEWMRVSVEAKELCSVVLIGYIALGRYWRGSQYRIMSEIVVSGGVRNGLVSDLFSAFVRSRDSIAKAYIAFVFYSLESDLLSSAQGGDAKHLRDYMIASGDDKVVRELEGY